MMGVVPQYICGLISRGKRETFPEVDTELEATADVHSAESELCTVQLWLYCIGVHSLSCVRSSNDCTVLMQLKFSFPQLCSPGLETWGLISVLGQVLHCFCALLQSIVREPKLPSAQLTVPELRPAFCPPSLTSYWAPNWTFEMTLHEDNAECEVSNLLCSCSNCLHVHREHENI